MSSKFEEGIKEFLKRYVVGIIVVTSSILFLIAYFVVGSKIPNTLSTVYHKYFVFRSIIVVSFTLFVIFGGILSALMRAKRLYKERQFNEEYFIETMLVKVASKETLKLKVQVALDGIVRTLELNKAAMFIDRDGKNLEVLYSKNFSAEELDFIQRKIRLGEKGLNLLHENYTFVFRFQIYGITGYIIFMRNKKLTESDLQFLKKYARAMNPLYANALLFDLMVGFMVELQKVGTIYNVYWKMLDMTIRVFNADSGTVLDVSKGKGNWNFVAVKDVQGKQIEVIEDRVNKGEGPVVDVIKNKRIIYIKDTKSYSGWTDIENMPRSCIGIPFIVGGKVVAIMNIHSDVPNKFTVYDMNLAKVIMEMGGAILERVLYLEQLGVYSTVDEITNLFNKREFTQRIKDEVSRARRYGRKLSMLIFDLDNFKEWNDTYGHLAGDNLLRELGSIIKNSIRSTDLAFRFGGDEFVILFPETSVDGALLIANKILKNISNLTIGKKIRISASAGITEYMPDESPEGFIDRADKALYAAKSSGKNQVYIAS